MQIQRLNMDSSWWLSWENNACLIDPWLIGSEVDGFKWLNEQWHVTPSILPEDLPKSDFILISQSYADHCHLQTLQELDEKLPILASTKAFKKLTKFFPKRTILEIPNLCNSKPLVYNNLRVCCLRPKKLLDPIYYGILIANAQNEAVFYAPHGFFPRENEVELLKKYNIKLLMATFSDFEIPKIMGGKVNPGLENVKLLTKILKPQHILNTHDEAKRMKGLVSRLAKATYPDLEKVQQEELQNFILSPDYARITLDERH